jgi:hypothetical protein
MAGETVWILPRTLGGADAHGNLTPTWPAHTDPGAVRVDGAKVAPRTDLGGETRDPTREGVIVGATVYLPPGVRLEPVDRMWVRGIVWDVIGEPGVWVQPWTAVEKGVQVALQRREG